MIQMESVVIIHLVKGLFVKKFNQIRIQNSEKQLKHVEVPHQHNKGEVEFREASRVTISYLEKFIHV